jgi:hypothetical protein
LTQPSTSVGSEACVSVNHLSTVVGAVLGVPGVAAAQIRPDRRADGAGTLHLEYEDGVDRLAVADAIDQLLRREFRLAVDPVRLSAPAAVTRSKLTPVMAFPAEGLEGSATSRDGSAAASAAAALPPEGVPAERVPAVQVPAERVPAERERGERVPAAALPAAGRPADRQRGERPPPPPGAGARGRRLRIDRVQLDAAGLTVRARVTLTVNGQPYVGEATGTTAATGVNRSVATATLAAAAAATGGRAAFDVDQLELVNRGGRRAVLAIVVMTTEGGSESLAGAAIVRGDGHHAVMRAALDAVNRRIEPFLTS